MMDGADVFNLVSLWVFHLNTRRHTSKQSFVCMCKRPLRVGFWVENELEDWRFIIKVLLRGREGEDNMLIKPDDR